MPILQILWVVPGIFKKLTRAYGHNPPPNMRIDHIVIGNSFPVSPFFCTRWSILSYPAISPTCPGARIL